MDFHEITPGSLNGPGPDDTPVQHTPWNHTLAPEEVREFQQLVKDETGVEMSAQDAWNRATELIALVRMLLGPLPEDPEG